MAPGDLNTFQFHNKAHFQRNPVFLPCNLGFLFELRIFELFQYRNLNFLLILISIQKDFKVFIFLNLSNFYQSLLMSQLNDGLIFVAINTICLSQLKHFIYLLFINHFSI